MPGTFTQLLYHIVFSTKRRERVITPKIQAQLHPYLGGIVRSMGGVALQIGGMPDHVHVLVRWRPDENVSRLLQAVKSRSSAWVHETFKGACGFAWQEGYAAFSVSKSQADAVEHYIAHQPEHHRERSFDEELRDFLNRHAIEYDERYLLSQPPPPRRGGME